MFNFSMLTKIVNLCKIFTFNPNSQRYATHVMASDMSGLLAPPSRSGALSRAHTDPTSSASNYEHLASSILTTEQQQRTPNSPPPTYEEVMKQVHLFDIGAPQPPPPPPPPHTNTAAFLAFTSNASNQTGRTAEKTCQRLHAEYTWTKQASFFMNFATFSFDLFPFDLPICIQAI